MKKTIFIVLICLLFTGCTNTTNHYKKISDIIVGLYRSPHFDIANLSENEIDLINNYLEKIRSESRLINIERFINYDISPIDEPNSSGVVIQNGKCFVNSEYIDFRPQEDYSQIEGEVIVICNGHIIFLSEENFPLTYEELIRDPKYNYEFLGYMELEDGYRFYYRSLYDNSGLSVTLIGREELREIMTDYVNLNDVEYKDMPVSWRIEIIVGLSLIVVLIIVIIINRKKNKES